MAKVLYRKYRSKSLSEIVGQDHITKTLTQALKTNRLSHAYLFTGPKGVGKTSVARILAHEVNSIPYTSDKADIDIIEIDAASNRRIDEIRFLRERVFIAPSSAKYKVYIIDEVHMLTKEAFNALLKILEEPPEHVIFILATTDAAKLPETIISRTQRFNFQPADNDSVIALLKKIAKNEKISIDDQALSLIAEHGQGSYRDSIGLLDQMANTTKKITESDIFRVLGLPNNQVISDIIDQISSPQPNYRSLIDNLSQLKLSGISPSAVANAVMDALRNQLISGSSAIGKDKTINLLRELIKVESSPDPSAYLEVTLLDNLDIDSSKPDQQAKIVKEKQTVKESTVTSKEPKAPLDDQSWEVVLEKLKQKHNTLYGILKIAKVEFKPDNTIILLLDFPFHQKKLSDSKNTDILSQIIKEVTGSTYTINCELSETKSKTKVSQDLENVNKVFGQTELIN